VDLSAASQAGLILDETEANFLAADPAAGGDPRTLNLATMQSATCAGTCYFTRTVENARSFATQWTFTDTSGPNVTMAATPGSFSLDPGATQEIEFAVTITGGGPGFVFGSGTFNETGGDASSATFTAAVQASGLDAIPLVINSTETSGMYLHENLVSTGAADIQVELTGVAPLDRQSDNVAEDPTNGDPYDTPDGTVTYILNNVTGARRLLAATVISSAPDLDLFVGRDANMNGIAEAGEQVCSSTTASAFERCDIPDPQDGDWWILIQNWQGSGAPLDNLVALSGVVNGANVGGFSAVSSNPSPAAGEQFDITVNWDFGADAPTGNYIGVLDLGTSPGNPDNLGTLTVDFISDLVGASGFEDN
ncbi:MAG: hypothetical protein R3330_16790, partial [Saprospiraceae bacterium]|nr:hypothetical protein [Saprospiraceae bacterium]